MKRFLPYILILVLLVGFFAPDYVSAQSRWFPSWMFSPSAFITQLSRIIAVGILTIVSWFTGFAGIILNFVLNETIVDMRENLQTLTGINIAWKLVKDLLNIAFIFLLVYEGIKLIIGLGSRESVKKFIAMIVLASILVNFSLFFTKVLIDASNILTIGIYRVMVPVPVPGQPITGISDTIMNLLGLQTVYGESAFPNLAYNGLGSILIFTIGTSLIFLITAFVWLAITAAFITRYLVLILLLMLSPIAFMGMALSFLEPYSRRWWSALSGQLLFAPIFMVMMLVTLRLMASPGFITTGDYTRLFSPNITAATTSTQAQTDVLGIILNFAVIIGLLIATLVVSKSTASKGEKMIGDATGRLTAFAGGAMIGAGSRIGRNTIGRAGNAVSDSEYLKEKEVSGNFITRNAARYARSTGTKTATSGFDLRNTGAFAALSEATGVKLGKGVDTKKVNFQKDLEGRAKAEADYAKSLKPTDAAKDKIKEQTGHTALEEQEKSAKTNLENSTKMANELLERQQRAESELKVLFDEMNTPEFKNKSVEEIRAAEIKSVKLTEEIDSAKRDRKLQIDRQESLKNEVKNASDKVKASQAELDKLFSARIEGYAKSFENESKMITYAKNAFRVPLSVVSSVRPMTKSDNIEIARKIRSANKEKSKKEKLAELAREVNKEEEEEKGEAPKAPEEPKSEKPEGGVTT